MKQLIAVAVALSSAPVLAAHGSDEGATNQRQERRVCTRVERRGASRLAYSRVCKTEAEWREALGADWRLHLSGRTPDEDIDAMEVRTRSFSDHPAAPQ